MKRIGYNTLRAFGGIVYTWPDQARPASWFVGAIRKALSDDPSTPVRMEMLSDEQKAVSEAHKKLSGCRIVTQTHLDSLLRGEGVLRLAVFGPECEQDHHDLAQWTWSEVVKYLNENAALVQHMEPLANEAVAQKKRMRDAQKIRTEEHAEQKRELDDYIRKQYRSMSQSLKSGEMQVKEVNAAIIDMVKARFTDDHGHGLVISQSRIDRAMGKKK